VRSRQPFEEQEDISISSLALVENPYLGLAIFRYGVERNPSELTSQLLVEYDSAIIAAIDGN